MSVKEIIYAVDALAFREQIRPALFGYIGKLEPIIADLCADALQVWITDVITQTMRATALHDKNGLVEQELRANARVIGRYSLASLAGDFYAYPWLRIHEFGGDIHPVNAEYLAIPIFRALRADGSPIFRNPRSWNQYGSFVYKQPGTGKLFLAYHPKGQRLQILYVLVDKVTIPARLGLRDMGDAMFPILFAAWTQIFVDVVGSDENVMGIF